MKPKSYQESVFLSPLISFSDLHPETNRLELTLTFGIRVAATWNMSTYPFLLNPDILNRMEEQVALADSGFDYNTSFLTDMTVQVGSVVASLFAAGSDGLFVSFTSSAIKQCQNSCAVKTVARKK